MAGFAERLATGQRLGGRALMQVTIASALLLCSAAAHGFCVGDCRAENKLVTVDELLTGVDILVNGGDPTACPEFDADESGQVTINEVVSGINNALHGCKPTPSCVLASSSSIILNSSLGPLPLDALGTLDVACGDVDPETGQAPCTCDVVQFEPLNVPGIGFVCVTPFAGCEPGHIDCDGGSNISVELNSDRNVGKLICAPSPEPNCCQSNDQCKDTCAAHCETLGKIPTVSGFGCEGFCNGGDRDGLPCNCDSASAETCAKNCSGGSKHCSITTTTACSQDSDCPAREKCTTPPCRKDEECAAGETCLPSVGDCPNGSCNGPEGVGFGNICQCQCVDTAVGLPTGPGGLGCNLGVTLIVERVTPEPCIGDPLVRLITVGSSCVPMTTDTATTILHNANNAMHCSVDISSPCGPGLPECLTNVCSPESFSPCESAEDCPQGETCLIQSCIEAFGPFVETGHGIECAALTGTGRAKGLQLRGVVSFFGSAIGDIVTQVNADCR